MSEMFLPKLIGSSYSTFLWILFLDVCKILPHIICSGIFSAGQKKTELSIFVMAISLALQNSNPTE